METLQALQGFFGNVVLLALASALAVCGWWIRQVISEKNAMEDRLTYVESRYVTEDEIQRVECRIDAKLDGFCTRITSLDHRMTERLDRLLEHMLARAPRD